ncbi:HAD hydrolase-like protein [Roseomonas sp. NAR14]|uniref:HAD hydrolase-like protein n=1 Tax=Roseomonas acroporae TaxID=2937791 RepID=A0A9X1Y6M1_9PROT|nr:HAD hydrolase-like protein [Roseomonas acroporae]MCK8784117.1 HAD hydrolase-like protein [Roseomonas acroporae]
MSQPWAALLDLDGTLIDSGPGIIASHQAALRALGHEPDPSLDLTFVIGPPLEDVAHLLLGPYGETRFDEYRAAYLDHQEHVALLRSTPYPGIPEALDALAADGATLYLATSKREVFARRILAHLGLDGRFRGIHGAQPGGVRARKPELLAHVLAEHGIDAGRAVMAGDRRYDITGAHANALRAVGVLWGYGTREELEEAGADRLAEAPGALAAAMRAALRG